MQVLQKYVNVNDKDDALMLIIQYERFEIPFQHHSMLCVYLDMLYCMSEKKADVITTYIGY